ncbi:hypothetical protein CONLIGDRAFT_648218 [Coniochaeta ligniaria NRRL 30616]|uniref:Uncharacterized protein n=1 Tax=Coniochaeta ligniaria NRRL 30616 TaxID=1408157 RepID=A0A1J7J5T9_9PEZI|nr:hypothetical protein CONLIGDRAFT_648218 [Coniochaeta ligniaria NRRL 30616]
MSQPAVGNNSPNGEDIPKGLAGRKLLVKELFDAMVNCNKASENMVRLWKEREHELFADDAPRQMARVKYAPHTLLETMCWELLYACIIAQHASVPNEVSGQDVSTIRPYPTFRQRFDKVKDALLNRKAFIDHMTDDQFIWELVIAPEKST